MLYISSLIRAKFFVLIKLISKHFQAWFFNCRYSENSYMFKKCVHISTSTYIIFSFIFILANTKNKVNVIKFRSENIKSKKKVRSYFLWYQIIILINSFRFWLQKTHWSSISQQQSTGDSGWKTCLKEEKSSNKMISQILKI